MTEAVRRLSLTREDAFFIRHQHVLGVLGVTAPSDAEPALGAIRVVAERLKDLGAKKGSARRARDCLNIVRTARLNSAADVVGGGKASQRAIRETYAPIQTLIRILAGDGDGEQRLRAELARALSVRQEALALSPYPGAPPFTRFEHQVSRRGEDAIDQAVDGLVALREAFRYLDAAYNPAVATRESDHGRSPAKHAQREALRRLANHFVTITGTLPDGSGTKTPGERVGDRFRSFVRLLEQHTSNDGFFSEKDFRALTTELRRQPQAQRPE